MDYDREIRDFERAIVQLEKRVQEATKEEDRRRDDADRAIKNIQLELDRSVDIARRQRADAMSEIKRLQDKRTNVQTRMRDEQKREQDKH